MDEEEVDENLIGFLTLGYIDSHPNCLRTTGDHVAIVFAEFSIWSHFYELKLKNRRWEMGIWAYDGENSTQLCASFSEFISTYLSDPRVLIDCWG